jgi:hypothetical protein
MKFSPPDCTSVMALLDKRSQPLRSQIAEKLVCAKLNEVVKWSNKVTAQVLRVSAPSQGFTLGEQSLAAQSVGLCTSDSTG